MLAPSSAAQLAVNTDGKLEMVTADSCLVAVLAQHTDLKSVSVRAAE